MLNNPTPQPNQAAIQFVDAASYRELAREQHAEALEEISDYNQVAGALLTATKGNRQMAEELLERMLDRLIDGGALSMRAYRGILAAIRA